MNYGYSGNTFGEGSGFLNVRPDPSAVAPNPSLRFLTNNVQRMIITNTGNIGIGTTTPNTTLQVAGGLSVNVVTKTSAYTMTGSDYTVLANAASGPFTVTLPSASNRGQKVMVIKTDSSANAVTVGSANSDAINTVPSITLTAEFAEINLIADGIHTWYQII
jgi:hypothetical protein